MPDTTAHTTTHTTTNTRTHIGPNTAPIAAADLELILGETRPLWEPMRGRRLFLTGGTGFFGCWLLESFCHANRVLELEAGVTVLTRDPARFRRVAPHLASNPAVTLLAGDVRSFESPPGEFAFVIHAATEASAKQSAEAPLEMLTTIAEGTARTLEFAVRHGAERFLLTSSGAVYGRQPAEMTHVPEDYAGAPDPLQAASVYAEGKRFSELQCALYQKVHGLPCAIARCWAFVGPRLPLDAHFAIGNFIGDVMAGRPIRIEGDGTPRRSYLYAADLAAWLWAMLFRAPALVPIHVGSERDGSILETAQAVARVLRPESVIEVAGVARPGAAPSRYVPQVRRAPELLGVRETVGLEEAIRRTAAWHGFRAPGGPAL
jgi:dTDP-glucose 4,6-dehydratase